MNIGDYISTLRFCTVRIDAIFSEEQEARSCGYTESLRIIKVLIIQSLASHWICTIGGTPQLRPKGS